MTLPTHTALAVLSAAVLSPVVASTPAQDIEPATNESQHLTLDEIKTLDQVRALGPIPVPDFGRLGNPYVDESAEGASAFGAIGRGMQPGPPDPRGAALEKVEDLRSKLTSPDHNQQKLHEQLRSALSEYFIADMRHRVRELDEIKQQVARMEAQLAKRLKLGNEAVELQLKIFIRDAEGLGFFRTDDRPTGPRSRLR